MKARVAYTASIDGIPKISAVLKSTVHSLALLIPPTSAVIPTINNE